MINIICETYITSYITLQYKHFRNGFYNVILLFCAQIQRPPSSAIITILDPAGEVVFRMDVSRRSSDVTFEGKILEFGLPAMLHNSIETGYQLIFERGVAKGATKCGVESEPYKWRLPYVGKSGRVMSKGIPWSITG